MSSTSPFVVGLDLGQPGEFSALAVVEVHPPAPAEGSGQRQLALRHLLRWPRGTSYAAIAAEVAELVRTPPLSGTRLVVDQTGTGRPVSDLVRNEVKDASVVAVTVTGGYATQRDTAGGWNVPKTELVSVMQVLLQAYRLRVANGLHHAEILVRELHNFRVKHPTSGTEERMSWREGDQDDLVFAVALACWFVERRCPDWGWVIALNRELREAAREAPQPGAWGRAGAWRLGRG